MGILLGLTAALSWGLADYFAAVASRKMGAFRVVLGFHLVAMVLLTGLLVVTGEGLSGVSGGDLAWLAILGVLGGLSYLAFYQALAIGPISIVSPIVSAYAAATVVCAVLIGGERLGGGETVAIVVVMLGVVLASSDLAQMRHLERIALLGILLALGTAVISACSSTASRTSAPTTAGSSRSSWCAASRRSSWSPCPCAAASGASRTARRGC